MHNYKALKAASKVSVRKQKVVDRAAVSEVKDGDEVVRKAQAEESHEVVQLSKKVYDSETGKAGADQVQDVTEARNHEPSEPHPVLKTPVRIDQTAVDTTVSQIDSESPYNIGDDLNGIFD